jgi:putative ABC transport system ATP-binding protein
VTTAVANPKAGGSGARSAVAAAARQVVKSYGSGETRVVALDHVDVEIARGAFTAIMGPSGSGKSTLMHCLAGLDSVTEGRIWVGEQEITGLKDKKLTRLRRDRIGFIFQAYNLLPTLNALENITLPMDIAGRKPDKQWLDKVIETVGLSGRLKHRPAVSSNASPSHARWRPSRRSSSVTSRRATSTPARAPRCWASCAAPWTTWGRRS